MLDVVNYRINYSCRLSADGRLNGCRDMYRYIRVLRASTHAICTDVFATAGTGLYVASQEQSSTSWIGSRLIMDGLSG